MSRLDLIVGPNGAGKSTFAQEILAALLPGVLFVNADLIARDRWPEDPERHAYDAAAIAAATRSALIESGRQFIAETVFSHPSKLALIDQAHGAGYFVALHVLMLPEHVAVARVAARVERGGHSVPEHKIRERYRRLWPLVAEAAARSRLGHVLGQLDARRPRSRGGARQRPIGGAPEVAVVDARSAHGALAAA